VSDVAAMRAIDKALTSLDAEAQVRVLEWAVSKFVAPQFDRLRSLQEEARVTNSDAITGITKVMQAVAEAAARLDVAPLDLIALINRLATESEANEGEQS
jgi:hypothetical protein